MKNFENTNKNLISRVANNISFLYFVEGDFAKAESYANTAIENERYNHKALVNKGNIHYIKEDYNKAKEKDAFKTCLEKIEAHGLPMKLIDVEYKYDGTKVIFYFTADKRIDFRELVKDLAAIFRTRIELRQIGVRDEVKRCGGNGICGRELCCCSFLGNFETVSIKMAKEQNISLNPSKISGNCGRLMCCLKYEQEAYEEKLSRLPKIGAIVKTSEGTGEVASVETLKEVIRVKYQDGDDVYFKKHEAKDVVVIKDAVVDDEKLDVDSAEELEELRELERMERDDKKNTTQDDI